MLFSNILRVLSYVVLMITGVALGCMENWNNQCKTNADCCSKFCDRPANWATGVCKPSNNGGGNGGGDQMPTQQEFNAALRANNFLEKPEKYENFKNGLRLGDISTKREAAMILAHMLHESGGLREKTERGCPYYSGNWNRDQACRNKHRGVPNYCGRGYLQLTYCANYEDIGQRLGLGESLAANPISVANDDRLSWNTAFKYWSVYVHNAGGVQNGQFGASTNAINGPVECRGQNRDKAETRFRYYSNIFREFKLNGSPDPSGCY